MGADDEAEGAIGDVLDAVTAFYSVALMDVLSGRRSSLVHHARCMGMYLAQKAGADAHAVGRRFGGRDPSIVEAVCRNMTRKVADDARHAALVRDLEKRREAASRRRRAVWPTQTH